MENKIDQAFTRIRNLNPPEKLAGAILRRVELEKKISTRRKILLDRFGIAGSILFLLTAVFLYGRVIAESEFWKLGSLAFTDLGIVTQNWQEFFYSLLETLPVIHIAAVLLPVFTLLLFVKFYLTLNYGKYSKLKT